jgi:CBS domain-containing protein
MKASDIMTKDVATIPSSATVAEAIQLMSEREWRSLIVDRDDEQDAYGIITETDITSKVTTPGKDPQQILVSEVMTKPCIVVNPNLSVENVAKLFSNHHLLTAPVIQGQLLGIISISDILTKSTMFEQLYETLSDPKLQELVLPICTVHQEEGRQSKAYTVAWDVFENNLSALSQQDTETLIHAALKNYFEEFEQLQDPNAVNNLCSG